MIGPCDPIGGYGGDVLSGVLSLGGRDHFNINTQTTQTIGIKLCQIQQ